MPAQPERLDIEVLYETYFSAVYNSIFYRLLDKEETEDLVSQIFMKVLRNLDRYDPNKASVKTWIFRIADNSLIDYYRKRRLEVSIDDETNQAENTLQVDFEEQYQKIASPERQALYRALTQLPTRDRMFIYYKYYEHRTNRDIAKEFGMKESTVGAVLARARNKLREMLASEVGE